MDQAFAGIKRLGGIESEENYPYNADQGDCQYDAKKKVTTVSGFKDIPTGDEKALTEANANIGPISVAIDASSQEFQFYSGGVYDNEDCGNGPSDLDHGVTLVGYGTEDGKDYYIVKNSWNSGWGLDGYIKMSRNKNNQCGIATAASYPLM
jgi:cathepsin L